MLGHLFKEHGSGVHAPSALVFKDLRAGWFMKTGRGPGGGRGRRGGRRGGRTDGRGQYTGNTRFDGDGLEKQTHEEDPLEPAQDTYMEESSRKRARGTGHGSNASATMHGSVLGADQLAIVPTGSSSVLSPPAKRDPKQTRLVTEGQEGYNISVKNLAGSLEEHRRAQ